MRAARVDIDGELLRALDDGHLILCVGPEPSLAAGLPDQVGLATALLERAAANDPGVDRATLASWIERGRTAQVLEQVHHRLGAEFQREVERLLSDQGREPPALAKAIAALRKRLRAIYTTRLDRLLERSLAGRWPSFSAPRPDLAQRRGLVFKLRGTLEFAQSWVLTHEQEEREFAIGAPRQAVFEAVYRAHHLLLVGFAADSHALERLLAMTPTDTQGQGPSHFIALPDCPAMQREQLERRGFRVLDLDALSLLTALGGRAPSEDAPAISVEACPYPGLEAFSEDRAAMFFGRHAEVSQASALLGGIAGVDNRWLAIEGPSGVGKSSFARAGVVPALRRGFAEGAPTRWRVATMRPGSTPLLNLAEALRDALDLAEEPAALAEQLRTNPRALGELARAKTGSQEGLLLLIDQLEEMVTIAPTAERTPFGEAVTRALDSRAIYLITTTRSDLVPELQRGLPSLAGLLNELAQRYALPPISRTGLREAICEPAARMGVTIAADLVEQILVDADHRPRRDDAGETRTTDAALPLVAHVLRGLWTAEHLADRVISLDEYLALGGIAGALSHSADGLIEGLSATERSEARELLVGMVRLQPDGTATRRVLELAEARELAAESVIGRLSGSGAIADTPSARLLLVRDDDGHHEVELVHEALIRDWTTLREWIGQDRARMLLDEDLARQAAKWIERDKPSRGLPGGRDAAELLSARPHGPRRRDQIEFQAALQRARRRRVWFAIGAVVAILGAGVGVTSLAMKAADPVIIEACHVVTEGGPKVREAAVQMGSGEIYPTKVGNGRDIEFHCPTPPTDDVTIIVNLETGEMRYFPGAQSGAALEFKDSKLGLPPNLTPAQRRALAKAMPSSAALLDPGQDQAAGADGDGQPGRDDPRDDSAPDQPPSVDTSLGEPGDAAGSGGTGSGGGAGAGSVGGGEGSGSGEGSGGDDGSGGAGTDGGDVDPGVVDAGEGPATPDDLPPEGDPPPQGDPPEQEGPPPGSSPYGTSIASGDGLPTHGYLESSDGSHYLLMHDNGKLCSYAFGAPGQSIWCSGGGGSQGEYLAIVQDDGALCVLSNADEVIWCRAPVEGAPPFRVRVTNTGKVSVSPI